jgi:UDP-glucose:(heptosyl)LPS alpha-1,3-glucosyltransferase
MSQPATDRLTVAVVRPFFTFSKGGAERYAVELASGLVALGHSVHVFAYSWDRPPQAGVTYHAVWMPRKPAWLRVLIFHWKLRRCLDHSAYDVVLGMTPFFPQTLFWLGDGLYAVWTRVAWPNPILRRLMCLKRAVMAVNLSLERKILSPATPRFVANSKLVQRQTLAHYGVPEERVAVAYPGVDMTRFHPGVRRQWRTVLRRQLGIGDEEVTLLFVSNNFTRKGLDRIIRSLAARDDRGAAYRLLVVGAGRAAPFRRLARRLGVERKIIFTGLVDRIERYYGAADVFILTTLYDPFAAVCLEAMACGLPVITTDMNGAAEIIADGESGFVIDGTADRLVASLDAMMDGARRARMGQRASEIAQQFSATRHLDQMESLIRHSAQARPSRSRWRVTRFSPELMINQAFLPFLERHGLLSYDALARPPAATEMTYNRAKRISFLAIEDGGGTKGFFIKRHESRKTLWDRVKSWCGMAVATEGVKEWHNIARLNNAGVPVVTPVAAGERRLPDGRRESFVATLRLDGYAPLDQYLEEHFAGSLESRGRERKKAIVAALAKLVRQFHSLGLCHRDLYLCHLFVKEQGDGTVDLRMIDLQRAGDQTFPARRWVVKDLAQLYYSSLPLPITDRDRLRFVALYAPGATERRNRKSLVRRVRGKVRAIAKRDAAQNRENPNPRLEDPFKVSDRLTARSYRVD